MTGSDANAGCARVAGRWARYATCPGAGVPSWAEFLGWLFAPSPQPSGSRAFRKRTSWCWGMRPVLELDAARHVVMADGTTPPAHAETDGTFDGDAPEPGTSIGWTDLHMPVFNT